MPALEEQIEPANEDEEGKEEEQKERDEMYSSDRDSDNASTDHDEENIRNGTREDVRDGDVTDEDEGVASGEEVERGNAVEIGEVVECGEDDDPKKLHWTRIQDIFTDQRTAPHEQTLFKNIIIDGHTPELDIFWSLMPLSPAKLLQIVRDGAEKANCTLSWNLDHINATLCIIFGGPNSKK